MSKLLLDTCALLWLAHGTDMSNESREAVRQGEVRISSISVWEIANLVRKNRMSLAMRPATWFYESVKRLGAVLSDLDIEILANSCALPGQPPNDPADRIIIATARENDMTVVTRDRLILDYARAGHVRAMAC